jgi:hypothetical protein
MIELKELSKQLQTKLNDAISGGQYFINEFSPNEEYRFNIVLDRGEYRKAERSGNRVTKYINGVITLTSDQKAGITQGTVNVSLSAALEIIVPDIDKTYNVVNDGAVIATIKFSEAVRELIDDTLAASSQGYMQDDEGRYFLVTSSYSFANTGVLDARYQTGDSLTLTVFLDYSIVASGVSAANIEIWIPNEASGERIYPARVDIARQSVQEGVIPSDSPSSRTATQSTQFSVAITKPLRFDAFDNAVVEYLTDDSELKILDATIKYPIGIDVDGSIIKKTVPYKLSFAEASIAGELNLAIPVSATLHEEYTYGR